MTQEKVCTINPEISQNPSEAVLYKFFRDSLKRCHIIFSGVRERNLTYWELKSDLYQEFPDTYQNRRFSYCLPIQTVWYADTVSVRIRPSGPTTLLRVEGRRSVQHFENRLLHLQRSSRFVRVWKARSKRYERAVHDYWNAGRRNKLRKVIFVIAKQGAIVPTTSGTKICEGVLVKDVRAAFCQS